MTDYGYRCDKCDKPCLVVPFEGKKYCSPCYWEVRRELNNA